MNGLKLSVLTALTVLGAQQKRKAHGYKQTFQAMFITRSKTADKDFTRNLNLFIYLSLSSTPDIFCVYSLLDLALAEVTQIFYFDRLKIVKQR